MTACIFCKIAKGEIPSVTIYEDDHTRGFLDINPISRGHMLFVPKAHVEEFHELPLETYTHLMSTVQQFAQRAKSIFRPKRVGLLAYGFDVAHAHIHVVPLYSGQELTIHHQSPIPQSEELEGIAVQIRS